MDKGNSLTESSVQGHLDALESLFSSDAAGQSYGESLSVRDHMLQTADHLRREGADDCLIAAGLLHDIGWMLGKGAHEETGADHLEALFRRDVSQPVRLHVDAKRYLVVREPGYAALLSPASVELCTNRAAPCRRKNARFLKVIGILPPPSSCAAPMTRVKTLATKPYHLRPPIALIPTGLRRSGSEIACAPRPPYLQSR